MYWGLILSLSMLALLPTTQVLASPTSAPACIADSAPNPIAARYPDLITGTLNETVVVVLVDYKVAREIVPKEWNILQGYKKYLPNPSSDLYPMVVELGVDHDIRAAGASVPDFPSVRITLPFIDLSGDGKSNYRFTPLMFLPPIPLVVAGAEAYGTEVFQSTFDPPCAAYKSVSARLRKAPSEYIFAANSIDGKYDVHLHAAISTASNDFPLDFYEKILNQPTFGNGSSCDNYTHIFDTPITKPDVIRASLKVHLSDLSNKEIKGVQGIRLNSAFIEGNNVPCDSLRGH